MPGRVSARLGAASWGRSTRNQNGIRLLWPARDRTTKPVASAAAAPTWAEARTEIVPGTVTVAGAVTETEPVPDCRTTATDHAPAPPPASVTATARATDSPALRSEEHTSELQSR